MAKKAELKAVLKLDNAHFVREIRKSIRYAKDLARQFARAPISTSFIAGILTARQAVKTTASGFAAMGEAARRAFDFAKIGAVVAAGSILLIAHSAISAAAEAESLRASFTVLLGSAAKGSQRMRELFNFSNKRGLKLTDVAAGSRTLETLTKGALSTGKGLQFVGDVAAGTRVPFQEMASTIGRLYDAMRSGQGGGEELARLQELGAISGSARRRIEALGNAKFGAEGWKLAQKELGKFNGMMEAQSGTWERMMDRFKDSIQEALRQFGTPLMEALKPSLDAASNLVFKMAEDMRGSANEFADGVAEAIDILAGFFDNPSSAVAPLMDLLRAGFATAGNVLIAGMEAGIHVLLNPKLYSGMAEGFWGVAQLVGGYFMDAFKTPIAYMQAAIDKMVDSKNHLLAGGASGAASGSSFGMLGIAAGFGGGMARAAMSPGAGNPSVAERAQALLKSGELDFASRDTIDSGKDHIANSIQELFASVADSIKAVHITDTGGAFADLARAGEGFKRMARRGHDVARPTAPPPRGAPWHPEWSDGSSRLRGSLLGTAGGLGSGSPWAPGGLFTNLMRPKLGVAGAGSSVINDRIGKRTISLLSLRERRQFENETVAGRAAAGDKDPRGVHIANASHAIRSGDRRRMQEAQRERLREKLGLEKTNSILEAIQRSFDKMVN